MTDRAPKIRVFVDAALHEGQDLAIVEQAHYLTNVMRQGVGDAILVFNGRDGEWRARLTRVGKREVSARVEACTAPQRNPPDLWLIFAPIKKTRTDFIVEKAAELGAARICPVQTAHTNAERIRVDRLQAHAVEAAEQCGGTYVPQVTALERLDRLLDAWPAGRRVMFCDEGRAGASTVLGDLHGQAGPWAILIGPEGGFSQAERDRLTQLPGAVPVSLGPRILRADTAAVAALALWQAVLGDWDAAGAKP